MVFTAKDGKSRRLVVLEILQEKEPDEIATYEELATALNLEDPKDRSIIQTSVYEAAKTLLKTKFRALEAVTNIGYRVVQSEEHLRPAQRHQNKASRAIKRSKKTVDYVDFNELSVETQNLVTASRGLLAAQLAFAVRMDIRQNDMEKALKTVSTSQEVTDEQVRKLNERLREVEARVESQSPKED